ncbi:MAG: YpdA family putative bacillithiol disulfide reductase [Gemmatimonadaceae bacterium]
MSDSVQVVIVGAGPCGLAAAIAMKEAGLRARVFDRSCVVSSIVEYPTYMTFFSTASRLEIGGVPFVVAAEKPTRRDAMAYYRAVVDHFDLKVLQYEEVQAIEGTEPQFLVRSRALSGSPPVRVSPAEAIIIATGYRGNPNRLGVPGEDLPHVTHSFREGHEAFRRRAVVVGGGNSAVEVALDLYRSHAHVTLVHFGPRLDKGVKPWVLPDITNRIADGSIAARWNARVIAIEPDAVVLQGSEGGELARLGADHVYLMTGYTPDPTLLSSLGVSIDSQTGKPTHDVATMETDVPGVFIAGVLAAGYDANKIFIENGRHHGNLIARTLVSRIN